FALPRFALPRLVLPRLVRRQSLRVVGVNAVKSGAPWQFGDLYYQLMEMGWPSFVAVIATVFLAINLGFGAVYAAMPGAIANAAPGSLADGFFFSVETLATVGYGNMAPATHLGHSVAVVEIMCGLFMTATVTGLIFSRFARPRESLIFSRTIVLDRIGDRRAVMIRLAGLRARPLADVTAQMSLLQQIEIGDGRNYRRLVDLPLVRQHNAVLSLAWTLVHYVTDDSPLAAVLADETLPFRLMVTVGGLDTLLATQTFGAHTYARTDLRHGHEFVDIIEDRDDGSVHLDLALLHETRATDRLK
ncbi:MAG: ion channel, partial [Janthinobacterium lividum]